ncbi:MAG: site-specific integrase [Reyranella sp.]|uniref:site-specific integrase n=1 Tax=Reyranella sp. TaxID=1929291 RepID=UPI003D0B56D4
MSKAAPRELFALVEAFFVDYLPRQRGASRLTVRAYRDTLKLLFEFTALRTGREVALLSLGDLDVDMIAGFLDHIDANRSNSAATRNYRRAALHGFIKHLVRNDRFAHSNTRSCWQYRRRRLGSGRRPTSRPMMCGPLSPGRTNAPSTVGATTRCCCSCTTAAPA